MSHNRANTKLLHAEMRTSISPITIPALVKSTHYLRKQPPIYN